jgi:hypothetical protein
MKILKLAVIGLGLIVLTTPSAVAGIRDAEDTRGPLDIRWVNFEREGEHRLRLTIGLWPGFRARFLAGDSSEGLMFKFNLPDFGAPGFRLDAYTIRKNGLLRLRQGDFGSSICCWSSELTRVNARTLTTVFTPWWIRSGEHDNEGVEYRARSKVCRARCLIDRTRADTIV